MLLDFISFWKGARYIFVGFLFFKAFNRPYVFGSSNLVVQLNITNFTSYPEIREYSYLSDIFVILFSPTFTSIHYITPTLTFQER